MIYENTGEKPRAHPGLPVKVPAPPSAHNLRIIFLRAIELGRIQMTQHFSEQCSTRDFSTLDAEELLRNGEITADPVYEKQHHSYKCELAGKIEGKTWKLVVG